MYHNEREVGTAIRSYLSSSPSLSRKHIHFTSKLASNSTSYDTTRASIKKSLKACGFEYIDLFLLHSPYGGKKARLESWRAVSDAVKEGEIKSAGVSNYGIKHLVELLETNPEIKPVVNQIEVHPWNTHEDICAFCAEHDIAVEAYAPLARAMRMRHPVLVNLCKKYGKTPGQILVRWSLQRGYVVLPKSVRKERIQENADVEGWEIDAADVQRLAECDEGLVTGESCADFIALKHSYLLSVADWDPLDAP